MVEAPLKACARSLSLKFSCLRSAADNAWKPAGKSFSVRTADDRSTTGGVVGLGMAVGGMGVFVGAGVLVGRGVLVGVFVGVAVGVAVGVFVGVGVGVAISATN